MRTEKKSGDNGFGFGKKKVEMKLVYCDRVLSDSNLRNFRGVTARDHIVLLTQIFDSMALEPIFN